MKNWMISFVLSLVYHLSHHLEWYQSGLLVKGKGVSETIKMKQNNKQENFSECF